MGTPTYQSTYCKGRVGCRASDVRQSLRATSWLSGATEWHTPVEENIAGNPDDARPEQLSRRAWDLIEPKLKQSQRRTIDAYHQAVAQGNGADRLEDVLWAGSQGRIAALMVARDTEQWGRFDPNVGNAELHGQPKPGDHELVNLAATMALQQSADVFAWPSSEMPTCEPVAAVLRY